MRKIPFAGIELTSPRVRGLRGTSELPGRPAIIVCTNDLIVLPGSNSRPNVSEGYEVPLSYRGDRLVCTNDYDLIVLHPLGIF